MIYALPDARSTPRRRCRRGSHSRNSEKSRQNTPSAQAAISSALPAAIQSRLPPLVGNRTRAPPSLGAPIELNPRNRKTTPEHQPRPPANPGGGPPHSNGWWSLPHGRQLRRALQKSVRRPHTEPAAITGQVLGHSVLEDVVQVLVLPVSQVVVPVGGAGRRLDQEAVGTT